MTNRNKLMLGMVLSVGLAASLESYAHGESQPPQPSTPPSHRPAERKPAPLGKCPGQLVCKKPATGADYPVCLEPSGMPPVCEKQSDCVKLGLGNHACTKVNTLFSLCVHACTP